MAKTLGAVILMLFGVATMATAAEPSGSIVVSATVVPVLRVQGSSFQVDAAAVTGPRVPLGFAGTWTYVRRDVMPVSSACAPKLSDHSTSASGRQAGERIQLTLARL